MRPSKSSTRSALVLLFLFLVSATTTLAQSPTTVAQVVARVNQERIYRGLVPYALNAQLTTAAQTQANDMSRSGKYGHTGSDGSTVFDRTARAGYGAYSWGRRVGENYAAYHDLQEAMSFWMDSRVHRENILHTVYREMGVGIAPATWGGTIYVLTFGSEPNVLPVFINDGAGQTSSQTVTLTLSNEDAYDGGSSNIAHVTEVQVSNVADFAGATWQPFASRLPWTLAPGAGSKTVYVKFRDARGRTAVGSDSIVVGAVAAGAPNNAQATSIPTTLLTQVPMPSATLTRRPTATSTRIPRPTATRTYTPEPSPTAIQVPTEPQPSPTEVSLAQQATELPASRVMPLVYYREETPARPVASSSTPAVPSNTIDPLAAGTAVAALALVILAIIKYLAAHPPI